MFTKQIRAVYKRSPRSILAVFGRLDPIRWGLNAPPPGWDVYKASDADKNYRNRQKMAEFSMEGMLADNVFYLTWDLTYKTL